MAKAIDYIGIARMAGAIETGEDNTKAMVKSGRARLMLLASDASPGAKRRGEGYVYGAKTPLAAVPYTKDEISAASGRPGCSMAAFTDLGLAAAFAQALRTEFGGDYAEIADALGAKQERARSRKGKRRKNV